MFWKDGTKARSSLSSLTLSKVPKTAVGTALACVQHDQLDDAAGIPSIKILTRFTMS